MQEAAPASNFTLIDTHTHLDDAQYAGDLDAVIARAQSGGITRMLAVGTGGGPPDLAAALRLADRYPFFSATIGVHPHDASKVTPETLAVLRRLTAHPKVVAFGEIGLDYHYDFSPRDVQRSVFAAQLEIAAAARLPVVIHTREAWDDTVAMLRASALPAGGILHCFTGSPGQAAQALELGFHLAFGGVITFPKAEATREAARLAPLDRLLVETDCPYLAPVPHRGKRNEPAFLLDTVKRLAEIRGMAPEELACATTANFHALCLRDTPANR